MSGDGVRQKLAAILAADVAGYSRLMADDERATIATLDAYRAVFQEQIQSHGGRVVDMAGDSVLALFDSATGAVEAAVAVQAALAEKNAALPDTRRMEFRIGVNSGDIQEKSDGTIYGDGVNVAARLESLATPGGVMISESAHMHVRNRLEAGFEDAGAHTVKNIAEPVRAYRVVDGGAPAPKQTSRTRNIIAAAVPVIAVLCIAAWAYLSHDDTEVRDDTDALVAEDVLPPLPTGPAVAVLPFETIGSDESGAIFAAGVAEDILTRLSYFKDIRVIGRSASFAFDPDAGDMRDFGRDLGAEFVLAGSVRRADDDVRLNVQLVGTEDGAHIWAETYDRKLTTAGLFDLQDEIANSVATTLGGALGAIAGAGFKAAHSKAPAELSSYECLLIAYNYQHRIDAESHLAARDCLTDVVVREPNYADARAWLGQMYVEEAWSGFNPRDNGESPLDAAFAELTTAIDLDPENQKARHAIAFAHFLNKDYDQFRLESQKAVAINPNNIETLSEMAWMTGYIGDWDHGMELYARADAMAGDPPAWVHILTFNNSYRNRDYAGAANFARSTLDLGHWAYPLMVAKAEAQNGDAEAARRALADAQSIEPNLEEEMVHEMWSWLFTDEEHIAHLMEGYRKAVAFEAEAAPTRPVIAVLPFDNLSGDPEQDYFAGGITEELLISLTRFRDLQVLSRGDDFQTGTDEISANGVIGDMAIDYIVKGSIRLDSNHVRVAVQIINGADGVQLWSDTYDKDLEAAAVFSIQEEIAIEVASLVGGRHGLILEDDISEARRKGPNSLENYECVLLAYVFWDHANFEKLPGLISCLEQTVSDNPDYTDAWIALSEMYSTSFELDLEIVDRPLERSLEAAERATALSPRRHDAYAMKGIALFFLKDLNGFQQAYETSLSLNRYDPETLAFAGLHLTLVGQWERGLPLAERAIELGPNNPGWWYFALVWGNYLKGDYDAAAAAAANVDLEDYYWTFVTRAVAHAWQGDLEKARANASRVLELYPEYSLTLQRAESKKYNMTPVLFDGVINALAQAGIPDGTALKSDE